MRVNNSLMFCATINILFVLCSFYWFGLFCMLNRLLCKSLHLSHQTLNPRPLSHCAVVFIISGKISVSFRFIPFTHNVWRVQIYKKMHKYYIEFTIWWQAQFLTSIVWIAFINLNSINTCKQHLFLRISIYFFFLLLLLFILITAEYCFNS